MASVARLEYTQREYAEMHFIYGLCNGNARASAREYRERYPNRDRFPDFRVFARVHRAYTEGRLPGHQGAREGRGRPQVRNVQQENQVLREVRRDRTTSQRRISRTLGIPRSIVQRIIKKKKLHAYHVQRVQDLLPADYEKRVRFCREMLERQRNDPQFFNNILWSDESSFMRIGIFNIHNLHYYARTNPHVVRNDRFQHQFSINMWAGIIGGQLLTFELPPRLNGARYLNFLQNNLNELLEQAEISQQVQQSMWLQHDGAPAHYAREVRAYLNQEYSGRWIGRGGPIEWPPRSPDLNPIDFFVWGHFKEVVFEKENHNERELRQKVAVATEHIKRNRSALRRLQNNFFRRCRMCIVARGRHFEQFL